MTKFQAKREGWLYKGGDVTGVTETYACDDNLFKVYQPKFKAGDTVRITQKLYGHKFKIGAVVKIDKVGGLDYLATNARDWLYVRADEIEKVCVDKQGV